MDLNARVGIGNTVKRMFKDEVPGSETEENLRRRTSRTSRLSTGGTDPAEKLNVPNSKWASHKVPTSGGTAIGGLQADVTTDQGLETMRSGQDDIAGLLVRTPPPLTAGLWPGLRVGIFLLFCSIGLSLTVSYDIPRDSGLLRESGTYDTHGGRDIRVGPTSPTSIGSPTGQPMGGSRVDREEVLSPGERSKGNFSSSGRHLGHTGSA